jgi:ribonucleoside-diphosphate reductase alpha chain
MDMYITALQPAPATPGPRSGDCLGPDPEAAGIAIKIAPISRQIWDAKYRLKAHDGIPIDVTIEDSWRRVARALAAPENDPERWEAGFYEVLEDFRFLPAGRILAGAGTGRRVTLFNCFVMGNVEDDLGSIFSHLREAALTMQQGGGIGYDFSSLRPKGAPVKGVGADASGPLSFMDVWDAMCRTIMSALRPPRRDDGDIAVRPSRYRSLHRRQA